jgi:hypothetical protein
MKRERGNCYQAAVVIFLLDGEWQSGASNRAVSPKVWVPGSMPYRCNNDAIIANEVCNVVGEPG